MFVIDTQAFANKESILLFMYLFVVFGRPGLARGTGDALDPLAGSSRAILELSELYGK